MSIGARSGVTPVSHSGVTHSVTHQCHTAESHTVSHTSVIYHCHTQCHTPESHTQHRGARHTPPFPPGCVCPGSVPLSHRSGALPVPGTAGRLTPGAAAGSAALQELSGVPAPSQLRPLAPGMRSQACRGAADGCRGAWQDSQPKNHLQRAGSAPCQQPRLPEHVPCLSLHGGCGVTPSRGPEGRGGGSALARWGREGVFPTWSAEG